MRFRIRDLRFAVFSLLGKRPPSGGLRLARRGGDKAQLGRWGEKHAEQFLTRKGLKTLTRNFLCKTGEIDLVMVDTDGTLVFVEVKTRASEDFSPAESAVTGAKRTRIVRAARYFLASHEIESRPYRYDVVTVVLADKGPPEVRHYQSAFVP